MPRRLSSIFARLSRAFALADGLSPSRARVSPRPRTAGAKLRSFERLQEQGRLVFTASLARGFFARHGTSVESRLSVFDKTPAENPKEFVAGFGPVADLSELLALVQREIPPRASLAPRRAMAMRQSRAASVRPRSRSRRSLKHAPLRRVSPLWILRIATPAPFRPLPARVFRDRRSRL